MKINTLILKILFLYFFIFITLFLSIYLMLPFNLEKFIFISFINTFFTSLILFSSMFLIYKNVKNAQKYTLPVHFNDVLDSNKKRHTNNYINRIIHCSNVIYFICKNVPVILCFLGIVIPVLISTIFKDKNILFICLLSAFSSNIFYIFSRRIF